MDNAVTSMVEPEWRAAACAVEGKHGTGYLERSLEASPFGCVALSLDGLVASAQLSTVATARLAVARLDPIDHAVSVDVELVDPHAVFEIEWAPVMGVIDLMLDWGLPVVEISVDELAVWLGAGATVARRALQRLAVVPGAFVEPLAVAPDVVRISLDERTCPLTMPDSHAA